MIRSNFSQNEMRELSYELLVKDIVASTDSLAPFPGVLRHVMPLMQRMAPVNEIEAVLRNDQTITSRVLSISQSSYYSRKQRAAIRSLREAISALRNVKLAEVIMLACVARYFQEEAGDCPDADNDLWQHSVATAFMSEIVARRLDYPSKYVFKVYTAGLLHDIGKTVLNLYLNIHLDTAFLRVMQGPAYLELERGSLGIDHSQLGRLIARKWRFPAVVVEAIAHHHDPDKAIHHRDVVEMVYVANRMVRALGIGCYPDVSFDPARDPIFQRLGITARKATRLLADLLETYASLNI